MVRFLINIAIAFVAGAVGLLVAAALLDGVTLTGSAFIIAVIIFTIATALIQPFLTKVAMKNANALLGGTALITTFLGLLITSLVSEGLDIDGIENWLLGTLIVWLATLLAALLIPVLLAKMGVKAMMKQNSGR